MRRDDLLDILHRIPSADHPKVMFALRAGPMVCLETVVRTEPTYLLVRGREAGNQDEGRAFFLPYEDIVTVKIERMVKLSELEAMFDDKPNQQREERKSAADAATTISTDTPAPVPAPALDPAEIAKQNLLDRIRAARSLTTAKK